MYPKYINRTLTISSGVPTGLTAPCRSRPAHLQQNQQNDHDGWEAPQLDQQRWRSSPVDPQLDQEILAIMTGGSPSTVN